MFELLRMVLIYPWSLLRPQHELAMEVLALRHQITVLKRQTSRPKLRWWDRCLWVMLKRAWPGWTTPLMIFRPETVIGWQRAGFRTSACYAYFYIQALYQLGRRAEAERILWPMMGTFAQGGFQNGVGKAGEWRHWDGRPSGYEGFLADAYYAQLAVFTGHYGIGFGPEGFRLEPWSPLKGKRIPLGLKFMGRTVK